ncbi:MAG: glycogen synthase GlgA [Planctomycetota bacterium]|nr:MAG: glycogen synthase GlgA [Planctomycetota bacterium]
MVALWRAAPPRPPPPTSRSLKICLVSSELAPFAKTGGLADVCSALARSLTDADQDIRVYLPMYRRIREGSWPLQPLAGLQDFPLTLGGQRRHVSISSVHLPDSKVEVRLVRCPELFDGDDLYGEGEEEALRFALLTRAALDCCQYEQWAPDILHCHDWHAALGPLYLKTWYAWDKLFERTRTVLTIHNIGYQGVFSSDILESLDLEDCRDLLYREDLEDGVINFLKTGLLYADALTTVSRTYAREIQTEEFGMGLEDLLRARNDSLVGIVNGVDYQEWNPDTDTLIPENYSAEDLRGKQRCKQALLEKMDLAPDPKGPVMGIVSRLTYQKGFELLPDILSVLLKEQDVRLVVLGSGEPKYQDYFQWLHESLPNKVAFYNGYSNELAHWIEAGSDLFLMPSRYEPCGLNQMYSLKYGTIPIVRRTGGLADTVVQFDRNGSSGTGFLFDGFEAEGLLVALQQALQIFQDPPAWQALQQNAMNQDYSWEKQVREYLSLFQELVPSPAS